jgi:hypothetical protein
MINIKVFTDDDNVYEMPVDDQAQISKQARSIVRDGYTHMARGVIRRYGPSKIRRVEYRDPVKGFK